MKALKKGNQRVYFPEFPDHPLNGASFERNGASTGELNGLIKRKVLTVFEETDENLNSPASHWFGSFSITPEMFGADTVKVNFWFCGKVDETYILEK